MIVLGKFAVLFDGLGGSAESVENFLDSSTWLHGNDSKLILFIDPDEEGLGIIMEDTTTRRPVSVEVASLEESVTFLEQEMVVDELLLDFLVHTLERIESTLEVSIEV